jgi:hypothetical protein
MAGSVLVIAVIGVAVGSYLYSRQVARGHQAGYQAALAAYRSTLTPGTTRARVEDYLRANGAAYRRSCCEPGDFSDLTRIGQEPPNLVCREWNVYIEFRFDTREPVAAPSDRLTAIDIYENGVCL